MITSVLAAQTSDIIADPSTGLYQYPDCEYIESKWNDGDSFCVRLKNGQTITARLYDCLLYTSPSPRDNRTSRMPSSA